MSARKGQAEQLHTCAKCGRQNFTERGLTSHRCRASEDQRTSATITMKQPGFLKLHPLLERFTMMRDLVEQLRTQRVKKVEHVAAAGEIEDDLNAFEATLDEEGIRDCLKVTKAGLIADGRHRWQWAMRRGVKLVPCEIISDEEARRIIETMMIARRHLTKSMRAYAAVLLHPEVSQSKAGGDRKSKDHSDSVGMIRRSDLAAKFGVSPDLIDQACKLFERFEESKALRDRHEKLVWAGFGLGGIYAGLAGAQRENTQVQEVEKFHGRCTQLRRLGSALCEDWELYDDDPDQRAVLVDAVTDLLQLMPDDLFEEAVKRSEARAKQAPQKGAAS